MARTTEKQRVIRAYKDETGVVEIDMKEVARWAVARGWKLPTPPDPLDLLAKQFSEAARETVEYDKKTGKPFRVYHSLRTSHGGTQLNFKFIDINEATRPQMLASLQNRREQMVSDGLMLTYDQDHWNALNPEQEPIQLPMDLQFDIDLRKAADDDDEVAA